jgi:CxxC motif-containing protein (DUF1111 family)
LPAILLVQGGDMRSTRNRLVRRAAVSGAISAAIGLIPAAASANPPAGAADPGVRAGTVDAGAPLPGLTPAQMAYFNAGKASFLKIDSVKGTLAGQKDEGLGPRFNSNSCASCHAQPSTGGSSPNANAFPFLGENPQVAVATLSGAQNQVPYFITANGPVREVRFPLVVANGQLTNQLDGGVHDVYTITGRSDATNTAGASGQQQTCQLQQPNFDQMRRLGNIAFRIPTPLFGSGLIESIPDQTIVNNIAANAAEKQAFGITGRLNHSGNDGTVTRFGWKAQNASLMMFSGEAYNVEQGVSNEVFTQERASPGETLPPECIFNQVPEDTTNFGSSADQLLSDVQVFATFAKFLAPPVPSASVPGGADSIQRGEALFTSTVKCSLCHTPSLPTIASTYAPALGPTNANLFSDLALHDMGPTLADGVSQGLATSREFRTAPLWGLGQRVFFMHDGRTSDLVQAILLHGDTQSEARVTVEQYQRLSAQSQQDLLNFLRSL